MVSTLSFTKLMFLMNKHGIHFNLAAFTSVPSESADLQRSGQREDQHPAGGHSAQTGLSVF